MNYTVLVIDDDEAIHFIVKGLLAEEYVLEHARNAQQAIDILAEKKINLIISDIHMPGLSGLELLKSLRSDKDKSSIPVLVMTNLPTVEKEQQALELGAADFIKKEMLNNDPVRFLEIIRMKLVTHITIDDLGGNLVESKNKLVMSLMESALLGLFEETVDVLCSELLAVLDANMVGFWLVKGKGTINIKLKGDLLPKVSESATVSKEPGFKHILDKGTPSFTNHIYTEEYCYFKDFSISKEIPAEVAIPLYSVTETSLLSSGMSVPEHADLFAVMIIKRKALFSLQEFELTSKLITQAGSILWRLFKNSSIYS